MGTSIPPEKFIDAAIETGADAILVSTIITHNEVHVDNMTKIAQLAVEKGVRDKVIIISGGTQITNDLAVSCGMDAALGRGTKGIHVASFLVKKKRDLSDRIESSKAAYLRLLCVILEKMTEQIENSINNTRMRLENWPAGNDSRWLFQEALIQLCCLLGFESPWT